MVITSPEFSQGMSIPRVLDLGIPIPRVFDLEMPRLVKYVPEKITGIKADYLAKTMPILNAIVEQNPDYKNQVGAVIYTFVQGLAGNQAPKITGMLLDIPIPEIHAYMKNYDILIQRVSEAKEVLLDMH